MLHTIISALLPIIVVFLLGYGAGWHHDFGSEQAAVLNRMVMLYAFPLSLFVGIAGTPRATLAAQMPLAFSVFFGMCASFGIGYLVCRYIARRELTAATLQGLAVGAAAVPFIGSAMLPSLIDKSSAAVAVSAAGFAMTLIQTPICLVLLSKGAKGSAAKHVSLAGQIASALREPVVWAPIVATVLIILDIQIPASLLNAFALLGSTTAGIALFASGIVLYSYRVSVTWPVVLSVVARNLVVPGLAWLILRALGLSHDIIRATVITLSIPVGSVVVILAVRFGVDEREAASTLFFSTILSVLTMAFFIAVSG